MLSLPQLENVRTLRGIAEKTANQGSVPQFWRWDIKQRGEETFIRSEASLRSAEFLEFALHAELKKITSLSDKDASRLTAAGGASAVPAVEASSASHSGGSGIMPAGTMTGARGASL